MAAKIASQLFDDAILKPSSSSSPPPTGTYHPTQVVVGGTPLFRIRAAMAIIVIAKRRDDTVAMYMSKIVINVLILIFIYHF